MTLLLLFSACAPSPDSGSPTDTADSDALVDSDAGPPPCAGNDADSIDVASGDCDDADASVYPGAPETCGDAIDQDCDGYAPRCTLGASLTSLDAGSTLLGAPGEAAGRWVGAADLDGDGASEVLVGAPGAPSDHSAAPGVLYAVRGPIADGQTALASSNLTFTGTGALPGVGEVAAVGSGQLAMLAGTSALLYGLPSGDVAVADATQAITGESITDPLGDDLAIPGDMNGDGYTDLVATSAWSRYNGHGTGKVYLFSGPIDVASGGDAAAIYSGEGADALAGEIADRAPDLNGDGALDLAVGAYRNDGVASGAGRAYVVYGPLASGAWNLADADVVISGADKGTQLGRGIDGARDLDHDGVDDLLLGGPNTASVPAAWVCFGGR